MILFDQAELEALREAATDLEQYLPYGVAPLWILSVGCMESDLIKTAHNESGAFGRFQRIGSKKNPYRVTDGAQQIRDYCDFTLNQIRTFVPHGDIPSLGHFYCLNLAPARVAMGILYAGPGPYVYPQNMDWVEWQTHLAVIKSHPEVVAPKAYASNNKFDVSKKGFIALEDLEPKIEKAVARSQASVDQILKDLDALP